MSYKRKSVKDVVILLYNKGLSIRGIAKLLNMTIKEVELLLENNNEILIEKGRN